MTKPKFPSEKLDQYMVRFPDGLRDRIKAAAEANNRSMNAEIVLRLEASFATGWDGLPINLLERISNFETLMRSEFTRMRDELARERILRGNVEDRLLQERIQGITRDDEKAP